MLRMLGINHGFPVWEGEDGSENCRSKAEAETREGGVGEGSTLGFQIPGVGLLFGVTRTGRRQLKGGNEEMESQRPKYRPESW